MVNSKIPTGWCCYDTPAGREAEAALTASAEAALRAITEQASPKVVREALQAFVTGWRGMYKTEPRSGVGDTEPRERVGDFCEAIWRDYGGYCDFDDLWEELNDQAWREVCERVGLED